MKHNTPDAMASNRTRASLGEQWMPVPTRLVDALIEAPSARRRMWAVAYLLLWLLTFRRKSKGAPATLGELEAWSATNSRQRTVKARKDAASAFEQWTDRGLPVDRKRTAGNEVETRKPEPDGLPVDRKRTAHAGADLHPTDLQDYKTPCSPPAGDAVEKPVDSVGKPPAKKRKRSTAMTLEQIAAVQVPDLLQSLPGWPEAWAAYCGHRQDLKAAARWKKPSQVERMLTHLVREHGKGNTGIVDALHQSAASGWTGVFPKPAEGGLVVLQGGASHMSADEAYRMLAECWGNIYRRQAPHERTGWRLCPDDLRVDAAVLATMQEVLDAPSTGSAWLRARDLRKGYEANQFERAFKKAFPRHWQHQVGLEVAS